MSAGPQVNWSAAKPITPQVDWSAAKPIGAWQKTQGGVTPTPSAMGKAFDKTAQTFVNNEPLIGMTVGGIAGGAIAGPVGAVAGASYGGAVGKSAQQQAENQPRSGAAVAESAALGAVSEAVPTLAFKGAGKALEWLRPKASEAVVPLIEQASRKLTNAINPNAAEANQFIENAGKHVPDILEYAKKTNNPLTTRLEFSKAATGAADEVRAFYKKSLLDPVAKQQVSIAGSGYAGKTVGEGQNATLGAIDSRLAQINRELRPAYRQRNAGLVGSKLASEEDLQAEASNLRKILVSNLAKASGMEPEAVAQIRSTFGSLYHLGEATDEAVTQRSLSSAKSTESGIGSVSTGALAGKAIDVARGKTDAIADRMFQRSLKEFQDILKVDKTVSKLSPEQQKAVASGLAKRFLSSGTMAVGQNVSGQQQ